MFRGRLLVSQSSNGRKIDTSFVRQTTPLLSPRRLRPPRGLGRFFLSTYLLSYTKRLDYSLSIGTLLLALFSLTPPVFDQIVDDYLSDGFVPVEMLVFFLTLAFCLSMLTLRVSLARFSLFVFSLMYGFFRGRYCCVVLWVKMAMELSDDPMVALVAFGILVFLEGAGNGITGPLSGGVRRGGARGDGGCGS